MEWSIRQLGTVVLLLSNLLNANTPAAIQVSEVQEAALAVVSSTPIRVLPSLPILPADLMAAGGCESNSSPKAKPRQFNKDGSVVRHYNRNGTVDYGAFQLNSIHIPQAKKLGLDFINSELDNYKMALVIYKQQGIGAWAGYDPLRKTCSYY